MDSENMVNDGELKPEFRKLSNDLSSRNYRRRSSPSASVSDGSPKCEHTASPIADRDSRKVSEHQRRKNEDRGFDRESGRSRYRGRDSLRHSDQLTYRNSHGYSRHDDYKRHDKQVDYEKRHYQASSHSGGESRVSTHSDHVREEGDHGRSRDYARNADKYPRDRYESSGIRSKDKDKDSSPDRAVSDRRIPNSTSEDKDRHWHKRDRDYRDRKLDYHKSSDDHRTDRHRYHEESRSTWNVSSARESGHRFEDSYKHDTKDIDGQMEKRSVDGENNLEMGSYLRAPRQQADIANEDSESVFKKPKGFSSNCKRADEKQSVEVDGKGTLAQIHVDNSEATNELNAAKVAAIRAAELVNKNLVGTGFMSAEQKKKLLWGNKKSTTSVEQPVHHWDSALFGDHERQEKFNKLMSLRLPWYIWPIVGCEGGNESGAQIRQSRLGEAEGASDGFRETIHCWTSSKGWPNCGVGSLSSFSFLLCLQTIFLKIILCHYGFGGSICFIRINVLLKSSSNTCSEFYRNRIKFIAYTVTFIASLMSMDAINSLSAISQQVTVP